MNYTRIHTAIENHRASQEDELRARLLKLPHPYVATIDHYSDKMVRWAMLHHLYRTALHAIRDHDASEARRVLAPWLSAHEGAQARVDLGCVPVPVDVSVATPIELGADMPTPVVDPVSLASGASAAGRAAVAGAVALLNRFGYDEVVQQGVALVVLLNRREMGEATSSWTTTALPGTVYLDWYAQPELLAKDLVHEATHAWLNDALAALGLHLPPDEIYYSPWKERHRSAYGMLHSIAAFSRVTNLLARLHGHTDDPAVRMYCEVRVKQERDRLAATRDAAYAALAVIGDADIAGLIRCEYEEAVDAPS